MTKVITLGALLTDTPHTRPTPVSGISFDAASAGELRVEPSSYQGPTGIVGVFQNACVEAGMPAISFWAAVPHYVSQARVPKAAVALLHRVEEVLDVEVPLGALPEQAEEWERTVSEMAEADDEVREYVRQLEEQAAIDDDDGRARGRRGRHRRRLRALPAPARHRRLGQLSAPGRRPTGRRERLARGGLYAGAFLGPFGGGHHGGDAARARRELRRLGRPARPLSVTAYLLPFAAVMLVSGTLGERWGRRRTVLLGYAVYVLASVACVLAGTLALFLAARALQGVANAFTTPLLLAALGATVPPERLGRALGWFGSLQAAGQTSAPLVGGLAAELDWRLAFVGVALVAVLLGLAGIPSAGARSGAATGAAHRAAAGRAADGRWSPRWAGAACPG